MTAYPSEEEGQLEHFMVDSSYGRRSRVRKAFASQTRTLPDWPPRARSTQRNSALCPLCPRWPIRRLPAGSSATLGAVFGGLDYAVLAGYFALCAFVGWWTGRGQKDAGEYFKG